MTEKDEKKYYTSGDVIRRLYRLSYIFNDIMIEYHIPYYASGGTLIGAIRHTGIIPWDNDVDFCIFKKDETLFSSKEVKKDFEKNGYRVEKGVNGWYRIVDLKDKRVSADVFLVRYKQDTKTKEWIVQHTGKALTFWPKDTIRVKDLYPLKERPFGSGFLLTPNRPEKALTSLYGKSWKTVGYITMDPEEHLELDEPIKLKVTTFKAAKPFHRKGQIRLNKDDPYLQGR